MFIKIKTKKYFMYQISLLVKNFALHEGQEKAVAFGKVLSEKSFSLGIMEGLTTKEIIYEVLPNFISDPCVNCMFNFITTWKYDYLL